MMILCYDYSLCVFWFCITGFLRHEKDNPMPYQEAVGTPKRSLFKQQLLVELNILFCILAMVNDYRLLHHHRET
jgi:hypothetical protein